LYLAARAMALHHRSLYYKISVYVQGWDVAKDFIKVFRSI